MFSTTLPSRRRPVSRWLACVGRAPIPVLSLWDTLAIFFCVLFVLHKIVADSLLSVGLMWSQTRRGNPISESARTDGLRRGPDPSHWWRITHYTCLQKEFPTGPQRASGNANRKSTDCHGLRLFAMDWRNPPTLELKNQILTLLAKPDKVDSLTRFNFWSISAISNVQKRSNWPRPLFPLRIQPPVVTGPFWKTIYHEFLAPKS